MKRVGFARKRKPSFAEKAKNFTSKIGRFIFPRQYLLRLIKELIILGPFFLLIIIILNFSFPKTIFEKTKEAVLLNPDDPSPRLALASQLLAKNQIAEAEKELVEADHSEEELKKIDRLKIQPEKTHQEILFWQETVSALPYFRDAYIRLAILNRKLYRDFDAKKFAQKALEIDPNNETAKRVVLGQE